MGGIGETSATYEVPELKKVSDVKRTANVYAVSDGQNNTIPIPKDFYYVGGNINTGIVISDNKDDEKRYASSQNGDVGKDLKGNQFVWIPCSVENYHKIDWQVENTRWDITTGELEKEQVKKYGGFYIGRYEAGVSVLDKSTGTFKDSVTFGTKSLNGYVTSSTNSLGWTWQNTDYLARSNSMQELFGSTYGQNKANGNIVIQADAIPYYHADWYTAIEMSERLYYNKSSVASGLTTGTQWDMMIKYLEDNGVAIKGEDCNWGNYDDVEIDELTGYYTKIDVPAGNTDLDGFKTCKELENQSTSVIWDEVIILTTASSEKVKKMNLYDVAGNLWEWTDESAYLYNGSNTTLLPGKEYNTFTYRGGGLYSGHNNMPACARSGTEGLNSSFFNGFRVVLYIK